jgi:hypothetical protein
MPTSKHHSFFTATTLPRVKAKEWIEFTLQNPLALPSVQKASASFAIHLPSPVDYHLRAVERPVLPCMLRPRFFGLKPSLTSQQLQFIGVNFKSDVLIDQLKRQDKSQAALLAHQGTLDTLH